MSQHHIQEFQKYISGSISESLLIQQWNQNPVKSEFFLWLYNEGSEIWNQWVEIFPEHDIDFSHQTIPPNSNEGLITYPNAKNTKPDEHSTYIDFTHYKLTKGNVSFCNTMFVPIVNKSTVSSENHILFQNWNFDHQVDFDKAVFRGNVRFHLVNFTGFKFRDVDVKKTQYLKNPTLFFDECTFNHDVLFETKNMSRNKVDADEEFIQPQPYFDMTFKNCEFEESAAFAVDGCRNLNLSSCSVKKDVILAPTGHQNKPIVDFSSPQLRINLDEITFSNVKFGAQLKVFTCEFKRLSLSEQCFVESGLVLKFCKIAECVDLNATTVEKKLVLFGNELESSSLPHLRVKSSVFNEVFFEWKCNMTSSSDIPIGIGFKEVFADKCHFKFWGLKKTADQRNGASGQEAEIWPSCVYIDKLDAPESRIEMNGFKFVDMPAHEEHIKTTFSNSSIGHLIFRGCDFSGNFELHKSVISKFFQLDQKGVETDDKWQIKPGFYPLDTISLRYCVFGGVFVIEEEVLSKLKEPIDLRDTSIASAPSLRQLNYQSKSYSYDAIELVRTTFQKFKNTEKSFSTVLSWFKELWIKFKKLCVNAIDRANQMIETLGCIFMFSLVLSYFFFQQDLPEILQYSNHWKESINLPVSIQSVAHSVMLLFISLVLCLWICIPALKLFQIIEPLNAERASKFARLKSLAHQSQEHDMALKFTAEEHKAKRYVEWGVWATFMDYWMAWICNYGRSIKRPIIGLVAINLVAFSYTDQWFDHHNNLPNKSELESALFFSQAMGNLIANGRALRQDLIKVLETEPQDNFIKHTIDLKDSKYAKHTLINAPYEFDQDSNRLQDMMQHVQAFIKIFLEDQNKGNSVYSDMFKLDVIRSAQGFFSFFFVILIGLGIRNRYKI